MISKISSFAMAKQQYKCLICNSNYSTKGCLKIHEDSRHQKIKFDCQECGNQFTQKDGLKTHINSIHKGIKYKCDQCERDFRSASARYYHV